MGVTVALSLRICACRSFCFSVLVPFASEARTPGRRRAEEAIDFSASLSRRRPSYPVVPRVPRSVSVEGDPTRRYRQSFPSCHQERGVLLA